MAGHFHFCDSCGFQYRCHAFLERDDDSRSDLCATKAHRVCNDCAGEEPSMSYADHYEALRAEDEQLPHFAENRRKGRW